MPCKNPNDFHRYRCEERGLGRRGQEAHLPGEGAVSQPDPPGLLPAGAAGAVGLGRRVEKRDFFLGSKIILNSIRTGTGNLFGCFFLL